MDLGLPAIGAAVSALLMLAVAIKWKLPPIALLGVVAVTIATAVPFAWVYPVFSPTLGSAIVLLCQVAVALIVAVSVLLLRFWRDPERTPAETEGVVLSAADGVVEYVWDLAEDSAPLVSKGGRNYRLDELMGTNLARGVRVIGVGMSFMDVHVNRCPIPGHVTLTKHIPGSFLSLGREEAPFVNERFTTVIESGALSVATVQIASRLVRRIENYLKVGETVGAGQRLGMIRFGSLVAIVIPDRENVEVVVAPGDRIIAGVSVLARCTRRDPADRRPR
jgi:phosphatidylserine decarboxylase